jgi:hypothetical protein
MNMIDDCLDVGGSTHLWNVDVFLRTTQRYVCESYVHTPHRENSITKVVAYTTENPGPQDRCSDHWGEQEKKT